MSQGPDKPQQFSIATLLLVMTLIGVVLALFRVAPVLGAGSLVLLVPAYLRTLSLAEREKRFGGRLSAAEKVAVYLGSLGVTCLILMGMAATLMTSTFVTVVAAGFVAQLHEPAAAVVGIGGAIGTLGLTLFAGGWMILQTWPARDDFLASLHRRDTGSGPAGDSKGSVARRGAER